MPAINHSVSPLVCPSPISSPAHVHCMLVTALSSQSYSELCPLWCAPPPSLALHMCSACWRRHSPLNLTHSELCPLWCAPPPSLALHMCSACWRRHSPLNLTHSELCPLWCIWEIMLMMSIEFRGEWKVLHICRCIGAHFHRSVESRSGWKCSTMLCSHWQ